MAKRGINKVTLLGNLGNEPEVKALPNGGNVTTISVATSESWKDKDGQVQERTEWHRVVFFGKLADIAGQYLHKGSKVYLEGALRTRKWQDQSGQDRYTTEIVGEEMLMVDTAKADPRAEAGPSDYVPANNARPAPQKVAGGYPAQAPKAAVGGGYVNDPDDISW